MEKSTLLLLQTLKQRGHVVRLISLNSLGALGPLLKDAGIDSVGLDYANVGRLSFLRRLRSSIQSERSDALIMVGHNLTANLALLGTAPRPRLLSIHFHHEGVMPEWKWSIVYATAWLTFEHIRFVSEYIRNEAESCFKPIRRMSHTVLNPFSICMDRSQQQRDAFRNQHSIPLSAPLVGNAGWLVKRKRFDVFIDVAREVRRIEPDAWFIIGGDGPCRGELEDQARRNGLADRLIWLGWQESLHLFYQAIDVLLFNSDFDALGRTPLEAMTYGVPTVISLSKGGLHGMLDSSSSWIFQEHDVLKLASSVIEALSPHGRAKAVKAQSFVRRYCDPDVIADRVEELLSRNS